MFLVLALDQSHHLGHASRAARDILVGGGRLFQGKAHEVPAPLEVRPIIEFVDHRISFAAVEDIADCTDFTALPVPRLAFRSPAP